MSERVLMAVARMMIVLGVGGLVFASGWYVLSRLSSDAVGILLGLGVGGLLFGVGAVSVRASARPVPPPMPLPRSQYAAVQLADGTRVLLGVGDVGEMNRALPVQRPVLLPAVDD